MIRFDPINQLNPRSIFYALNNELHQLHEK